MTSGDQGIMATRKSTGKPSRSASARSAAAQVKPVRTAKPNSAPREEAPQQSEEEIYPIAAIGASAGGLEAFTRLIGALPADAQLTFILLQHLSPNHESMLQALIAKVTPLPVVEARDGEELRHGTVYVMPPNVVMTLDGDRLKLRPRPESGHNMPIDVFFRSLSVNQPHRAIAIILSGAGTDGALGLQEVKAAGGITFAQEARSAKFDGMPLAAASTGSVDFVLPPEQIAAELARICHQYRHKFEAKGGLAGLEVGQLGTIFAMLRRAHGVDFTQYKQNTIQRRILRRMLLERIETLAGYVEFLRQNPAEVHALYQDLLIKVTGFFRDPEAFEVLKHTIFPAILKNRPTDGTVRIWVPGCATGEEVYSLAITLLECMGDMSSNIPVQIFATDISEESLARARLGLYVENIALDVSPERLRRFFTRTDTHYQISKHIRDMCVFARHDLTQDHPFSRIDLISCRNLLIYLDLFLQKKVFPVFHYALKPGCYLMLGTSETVGSFTDLFALEDRRYKIYVKKVAAVRFHLPAGPGSLYNDRAEPAKRAGDQAWSGLEVQKEADRLLLANYAPPGAVVNSDMDILQFRGQTGPYLEPAPGQASLNLLKMVRSPLLLATRRAVDAAKRTRKPARSELVRFEIEGKRRMVEVEAVPLAVPSSPSEDYFVVLFREAEPGPAATAKAGKGQLKDEKESKALRKELESTKEYLQSIIEEQEATNEELKSANEEILSSNEELQSINEELETAKEELQSTNEELTTLNEELLNRNLELNQVNNDMSNLFSSVHVPIVMLGRDLRIRRFTPMAEKMLKLLTTDLGRPFGDIKALASLDHAEPQILEVIDTMTVREMDVKDEQGRWYSLRIRPYRTHDNKIDGAVLVFIDIDTLKHGMAALEEANDYAEAIIRTVPHPMVVLERDGRIKTANAAFLEAAGQERDDVLGRPLAEIEIGGAPIPGLRDLLARNGEWVRTVKDVEVEVPRPEGPRTLLLNAGMVRLAADDRSFLLLAAEDITARKASEREVRRLNGELEDRIRQVSSANRSLEREVTDRQRAEEGLREIVKDLEAFSFSVSHDLRAPLRSIQGVAEALREDYADRLDETGRDYARRIVEATQRLDRLLRDLLTYSRVGREEAEVRACSIDAAVRIALDHLAPAVRAREAKVDVSAPLGEVLAVRSLLEMAIVNLLSNALKFTAEGVKPQVHIGAETRGSFRRIWIEDNGIGIPPADRERVFRPFERLHGMEKYPGTGIGLAIVRKGVETQGGQAGVEERPGGGSRFWIELPGGTA
jgi:two-component system CheB/CheR fusion protein